MEQEIVPLVRELDESFANYTLETLSESSKSDNRLMKLELLVEQLIREKANSSSMELQKVLQSSFLEIQIFLARNG